MDEMLERVNSIGDEEMKEYSKNLMVGGGSPGPCLVGGKGVRVYDSNGKSYIDCTSQSWALYLGYANDEITEVVHDHMKNLSHVHQGFQTKIRYCLSNKLASLAPKNLNRVSYTVGGGPAIEAAMKIALKNVKGSKNFISLWDAYHGCTLTAAGASWITTKAAGDFTGMNNFLPDVNNNFVRVPNPYCYRCVFGQKPGTCGYQCAEMLRETVRRGVNGPVAGVILEPIQASAGQIICPKEYLQRVRQICDEFGALLIFDEIQTYCRIGKFFAAEYFDVEPDIIVLGKALGAGLPIAAIIIHDRLEGFSLNIEELHTFANNSASQVAALKQIEMIERGGLLENTVLMGNYIADGITDLQKEYKEIGDIRSLGLHIGVELIDNPETKQEMSKEKAVRIKDVALSNGLILGAGGFRKHLIKIKPPLIVNKDEANEIIEIFEYTLKTVLR